MCTGDANTISSRRRPSPTAVLIHGVMGSRRNLHSFAKSLSREVPNWNFLLVDLRCHGESASIAKRSDPHTVESAAADVHALLRKLRITPRCLIGHSFGGKV